MLTQPQNPQPMQNHTKSIEIRLSHNQWYLLRHLSFSQFWSPSSAQTWQPLFRKAAQFSEDLGHYISDRTHAIAKFHGLTMCFHGGSIMHVTMFQIVSHYFTFFLSFSCRAHLNSRMAGTCDVSQHVHVTSSCFIFSNYSPVGHAPCVAKPHGSNQGKKRSPTHVNLRVLKIFQTCSKHFK